MTMTEWAEREIRLAIEHERKNVDEGTKAVQEECGGFEYGVECYKSALKAYKCLSEDGHSGFSWGVTTNILNRLFKGLPLIPITDEDFFSVKRGTEEFPDESPVYLKERGLKSSLQCPRLTSLFREETLDGEVKYHDNNRVCCVEIDNEDVCYHSWTCKIVDELFPITMPYMPTQRGYKIYEKVHYVSHGCFDGKEVLFILTPEGEKIEVNRYFAEVDGEHMKEVSKEEYLKFISR